MVCKLCGAEVADSAKFCSECGAKIERQICCKKCGMILTANAKFCPECGEKVDIKSTTVNYQSAETVEDEDFDAYESETQQTQTDNVDDFLHDDISKNPTKTVSSELTEAEQDYVAFMVNQASVKYYNDLLQKGNIVIDKDYKDWYFAFLEKAKTKAKEIKRNGGTIV
jgi:RNA polymerase subunit RPABC4/transcription elongation factor Spt4